MHYGFPKDVYLSCQSIYCIPVHQFGHGSALLFLILKSDKFWHTKFCPGESVIPWYSVAPQTAGFSPPCPCWSACKKANHVKGKVQKRRKNERKNRTDCWSALKKSKPYENSPFLCEYFEVLATYKSLYAVRQNIELNFLCFISKFEVTSMYWFLCLISKVEVTSRYWNTLILFVHLFELLVWKMLTLCKYCQMFPISLSMM